MKFVFEDYPELQSLGYCTRHGRFTINGLFLPNLIGQFHCETEEVKAWLVEVNLSHQAVYDIINRSLGTLGPKLRAEGKKEFTRQDFIKD